MMNQKKMLLAILGCFLSNATIFGSNNNNNYKITQQSINDAISLSSLLSNTMVPDISTLDLKKLRLPQEKRNAQKVSVKRHQKLKAQQLILQEVLMHLAKKRYIYEMKTKDLRRKQFEIITTKHTFSPKTRLITSNIRLKSPEAIALHLRYNALIVSPADYLEQDYPELLDDLRKELPTYLNSPDQELAEEAKLYQLKLEMFEAKKGSRQCIYTMNFYLKENKAVLSKGNFDNFLQYLYLYHKLQKQYPGDSYAQLTPKRKEQLYAAWYKQALMLQGHHTKHIGLIKRYYNEHIRFQLQGNFAKFNDQVMPKTLNGDLTRFVTENKKTAITNSSTKNKSDLDWLQRATQSYQKNNRQNANNRKKQARSKKKKPNRNAQKENLFKPANNIKPANNTFTSNSSSNSCSTSTQNNQTQATLIHQFPIKKPDDSYVLSKTNTMITIKDQKHNCTLKLFKLDKPNADKLSNKTTWTQNIKDWIHAPNLALKTQGYHDSTHKNYTPDKNMQEYMTIAHSFPLAADDFINKCGIQQNISSRKHSGQDIMISVPCAYYLDNKPIIGLLIYIYNPNTKQLFHRMFHTHKAQDLIQEYKAQGKWNIDIDKLEI